MVTVNVAWVVSWLCNAVLSLFPPRQKDEQPTQHIQKQNKNQEEREKVKGKESDGVQVLREIRR